MHRIILLIFPIKSEQRLILNEIGKTGVLRIKLIKDKAYEK